MPGPGRIWTVEDHLRGADPRSVELWHLVAEVIRGHGDVTLSVARTTITFKGSRRGFAGARPTRDGVVGYLDLTRSLAGDPRIRSAAPYTKRLWVNHFALRFADEVDDTFRGWVAEAYRVGEGDHLRS